MSIFGEVFRSGEDLKGEFNTVGIGRPTNAFWAAEADYIRVQQGLVTFAFSLARAAVGATSDVYHSFRSGERNGPIVLHL